MYHEPMSNLEYCTVVNPMDPNGINHLDLGMHKSSIHGYIDYIHGY